MFLSNNPLYALYPLFLLIEKKKPPQVITNMIILKINNDKGVVQQHDL